MAKFKSPKRVSASKVWISDIIDTEYNPAVGFTPGYVIINGVNVSRVNMVATVVSKFISDDGNYGAVTLDDGTETIRVKAFGPDVAKITATKIGDLIRFIGKVKHYNEENYLAPEGMHVLDDPNWVTVHKIELGQPMTAPTIEETKPIVPEAAAKEVIKQEDAGVQGKVLELIKKLDEGEGADMQQVIAGSGLDTDEAKNIIVGLLKNGEVFEPRKERLKVLD